MKEHDMPTRREADQILYGVVETIGEIRGELKEFNRNQREQNKKLDDILEKHSARMDSIEGKTDGAIKRIDAAQNKAIGFGFGAGAGGTGVMVAILKVLGILH